MFDAYASEKEEKLKVLSLLILDPFIIFTLSTLASGLYYLL